MADGPSKDCNLPSQFRHAVVKHLYLSAFGALVLVVAIAVPFLTRPTHFSGFNAVQSNFVKDLYSGTLGIALPSSTSGSTYEKYSMNDGGKASLHLDNSLWGNDRDEFSNFPDNEFKRVEEEPVSTFSADVDTASYSYVRRTLLKGYSLPHLEAVKAEEMINYFDYEYPGPKKMHQPFNASVRVSDAPWSKDRKLVHIGIKGYDMQPTERRFSNLVFLIDVSGSMCGEDRLPLVKSSIELLLPSLDPEDLVAIVSYANTARVVLSPTLAGEKNKILKKLRQLEAHGGTGGAGGLELAYKVAEQNYDRDAVNRIILATDGDFNVGPTNNDVLQKFVESKREKGIYLSVLGYGMGNYKDSRMKALANHGNGVATYIDTLKEAKKVLVDESSSTLFPIANDVKLQVEFNPTAVSEYRLIGYEKRLLRREDFNNDKVDAGDVGSGHTVTAIYQITLKGSINPAVDELRYSRKEKAVNKDDDNAGVKERKVANSDEYAYLKIRYKLPGEKESKLLSMPIVTSDAIQSLSGQNSMHSHSLNTDRQLTERIGREFDFSTAVAAFAQLLKGGKNIDDFGYDDVVALAKANKGEDEHGYRDEFIELVWKAKRISRRLLSDMSRKGKNNIDKPKTPYMSQKSNNNIDKPKMPSLDDLLKELDSEDEEEDPLTEKEQVDSMLDKLMDEEEDIDEDEE